MVKWGKKSISIFSTSPYFHHLFLHLEKAAATHYYAKEHLFEVNSIPNLLHGDWANKCQPLPSPSDPTHYLCEFVNLHFSPFARIV